MSHNFFYVPVCVPMRAKNLHEGKRHYINTYIYIHTYIHV
jgi:hypothetical protein